MRVRVVWLSSRTALLALGCSNVNIIRNGSKLRNKAVSITVSLTLRSYLRVHEAL